MPNNSFYIDLSDATSPTVEPAINATTYSVFPDANTGTIGYNYYAMLTNTTFYNAFLYNPVSSNKILKIKNLDYKFNSTSTNTGYSNVIIALAGGLTTGSIESYQKLDTNSPDLPAGVGLSLNPAWTYTNSGSFIQRPLVFNNPSATGAFNPRTLRGSNNLNSISFYSGQKIGTSVQDITLNPNQHLVIAFGNNLGPNPKIQISVLFSSGSNTYYTDASSAGAAMYLNSSNTTANQPAVFVNNSNTTIKIHSLEVNFPYRDLGYNNWGLIITGTINSKLIGIDHVTADRIPNDITNYLINADKFPIISLDSTISPPTNVLCYRCAVNVQFPSQYDAGPNINYASYLRPRLFRPAGANSYYNPNQTGVFGLGALNNFTQATKQKINFNQSGQEIIIRPGEGLGFLLYGGQAVQDIADGNIMGHVTFTAEDIPSTTSTVETGFGY